MDFQRVEPKKRPRYEVADILRRYGASYEQQNPLTFEQQRLIRDLTECRTARLGGHVDLCDQCQGMRIAYNSCRNRHCPKCGSVLKAEWIQKQKSHLLPTHYFHVVFTIDHELLPIVRANRKACYERLMRSAASSLKKMGHRYLGGEVGVVAILHTWGQQLTEHPHVHCLVPGGALAKNGKRWRQTNRNFLFPIEELSNLFKENFLQALDKLNRKKQLPLESGCANCDSDQVSELLQAAHNKKWQVYAKPPFGDAEEVVEYLGRYTQRIAISNHRIEAIDNDEVCFRYRDYRDEGREKTLTLSADEFIRRFLLHMLPWGFVRIRYYGLLATAQRAKKIAICRRLLMASSHGMRPQLTRQELIHQMLGRHPDNCPTCQQGQWRRFRNILPHPSRRAWLHAVGG